ncbi:hypothetical protein CYMTET_34418 [Cymbomonas tetramitiformis]|uniref:Uncharacterized protein n=1 Tax=Cymbomonas tetramitiformis TaxID=36881 RepID=A0AAE0FB63_9CHLO|nr:hypothetical protein CYMTET_34418 [Cymbomonas tetramitiformis]
MVTLSRGSAVRHIMVTLSVNLPVRAAMVTLIVDFAVRSNIVTLSVDPLDAVTSLGQPPPPTGSMAFTTAPQQHMLIRVARSTTQDVSRRLPAGGITLCPKTESKNNINRHESVLSI